MSINKLRIYATFSYACTSTTSLSRQSTRNASTEKYRRRSAGELFLLESVMKRQQQGTNRFRHWMVVRMVNGKHGVPELLSRSLRRNDVYRRSVYCTPNIYRVRPSFISLRETSRKAQGNSSIKPAFACIVHSSYNSTCFNGLRDVGRSPGI